MMTDRVPFEEVTLEAAIVLNVIQGQLPLIHENEQLAQVIRLCSLMSDCWKFEPDDRPQAAQCCSEVKWMVSATPMLSSEAPDTLRLAALGPASGWRTFWHQGTISSAFTAHGNPALLAR